jgi:hypothetical protein
MDGDSVAVLDLDQHVERRRRLALEHGFLRPSSPRFLVGKGHALDSAQQVVESRVDQQVLERLTMRGGDELHATFRDRPRSNGF